MKRLSELMADDGDMECYVFVEDVADLERDLDAESARCQGLTARLDRACMELRAAEAARDGARADLAFFQAADKAIAKRRDEQAADIATVRDHATAGMAVVHFFDLTRMHVLADERRALWGAAFEHQSAAVKARGERDEARARMRAAARDIVFAMRIYSGYTLTSRGPRGLMWDALEQLAPEVHATVATKDWDAAWDEHFAPEDPLPLDDEAAPVDTRTGEVTRGWAVFLAERDAQRSARGPASVGGWKVGDACEARDVYGTWHAATIADLSTLHGVEEVVECSLANGRKAFVDVGGLRRPAPEATQEWAVGDACEFIQSGDGDDAATWEPGTIVGFTDGGIVIDPIPPRKYFSWRLPEGVRRPVPPTAMEPRMEGGRGLDEAERESCDDLACACRARRPDAAHLVANALTLASEAHHAPGDGPLHAEWRDKPHRVVYDLCATVRAQADVIANRDTRIADLERRLREAEGQRDEAIGAAVTVCDALERAEAKLQWIREIGMKPGVYLGDFGRRAMAIIGEESGTPTTRADRRCPHCWDGWDDPVCGGLECTKCGGTGKERVDAKS